MKTEKHDQIHLWIYNQDNLKAFCDTIMRSVAPQDIALQEDRQAIEPSLSKDFHTYDYKCTEMNRWHGVNLRREVPISKSRTISHTNTIDMLIELEIDCKAAFRGTYSGNEWKHTTDHHVFNLTLLCEFKPKLESISSLLGQIHVYSKLINRSMRTIIPVVLTLDDNRDYDELLTDEGIRIFRLEFDSYRNKVVRRAIAPLPQNPASSLEFAAADVET